ncbi:hypothetical protein VP01_3670g3, partial [Puccinia sorghi]
PYQLGSNDGFLQSIPKTELETILQLTEENYSIWKDKMTSLLKPHSLKSLNDQTIPLGDSNNAELTMLLIAKMDHVTMICLISIIKLGENIQ